MGVCGSEVSGCPLLKSASDDDDGDGDGDYYPGSSSTTLVTSIVIGFAATMVFCKGLCTPQNTSSYQMDRQMKESASENGSTCDGNMGKLEYSNCCRTTTCMSVCWPPFLILLTSLLIQLLTVLGFTLNVTPFLPHPLSSSSPECTHHL